MYLLDTNILSDLIKRKPDKNLQNRLGSEPASRLFTSCICIMELRFGSALRDDFKQFWKRITEEIVVRVNVLPISENEALTAGDILADLRKSGQIIGLEDVLIAASALNHRQTVVTANVGHFSRIPNLHIENWLEQE